VTLVSGEVSVLIGAQNIILRKTLRNAWSPISKDRQFNGQHKITKRQSMVNNILHRKLTI